VARRNGSSGISRLLTLIGITTGKASAGGTEWTEDGEDKSFQDLVRGQAKRDKKFAAALLREGIDAMLSGDMETGKTILRDYIKATVGFEELGEATGAPPKSLIRMFGPRGNPQAKNLFNVIGYLQKRAGLQLHVTG
jgi:DNA-binding phage protein